VLTLLLLLVFTFVVPPDNILLLVFVLVEVLALTLLLLLVFVFVLVDVLTFVLVLVFVLVEVTLESAVVVPFVSTYVVESKLPSASLVTCAYDVEVIRSIIRNNKRFMA